MEATQSLQPAAPLQGERSTLVSVGRSGATAVYIQPGGIELVRIEDRARIFIDAPPPAQFGFGGGGLWLLAGDALHWMDERGRCLAECFVGDRASALAISRSALPAAVFCGGDGRIKLVELYDSQLFSTDIDWVRGHVVSPHIQPIGPRTLAVGGPGALYLIHIDRGLMWSHLIPAGGALRAATALFSGRSIAALVGDREPTLMVMSPGGEPLLDLQLGRTDIWAVAEDRGIVFCGSGAVLRAYDLLDSGRVYEAELPFVPDAIDTCARGRELAFAQRVGDRARVWHAGFTDIFDLR